MAFLVEQFVKNPLLLSLTILVCWLHVTAARTVQLKHTRPATKRDSMPDELHVTLTGENGTSGDVKLRLLQHSVPDVPVYTLGVDESGQHVKHLEELEVNPNVAYYHDLNNHAVMQVTRIAGRGDIVAFYELQGDLAIEGHKYSLNPNKRFQREPSSASEAELYTLVPQEPTRSARHDHLHSPSQVQIRVVEAADAISPDLGNILAREIVKRQKHKRVKKIFIDVAAVVDYVAYSRFLTSSQTEMLADAAIRLYYAFIFSGMDLLYKSIDEPKYPITIRLIKVHICKTAVTSQFTEQFVLPTLNQTDGYKALTAFKYFSQGNILHPNDHAMLFSGYDLVEVDTHGTYSGFTGLAYMSSLCNIFASSASIVEDRGIIHEVVKTAAHELGHSLGAEHDQDGNTCQDADGFIMSSGYLTPTNHYNAWLFSNCSIASFKSFINDALIMRSGVKCLWSKISAIKLPTVDGRLPGEVYSVHEQCRMIHGNRSHMCRMEPPPDVCLDMPCLDPSDNLCYYYTAAMGTTCGNRKICVGGRCTYFPKAASVYKNCVFGDIPGVAFGNQSCSKYVHGFRGRCYNSEVKDRCCKSCNVVSGGETGCMFGDKETGCVYKQCTSYTVSRRNICCKTCSPVRGSPPFFYIIDSLKLPTVRALEQEDDHSQD